MSGHPRHGADDDVFGFPANWARVGLVSRLLTQNYSELSSFPPGVACPTEGNDEAVWKSARRVTSSIFELHHRIECSIFAHDESVL